VDPVALPQYFNVIDPKDARDLKTIKADVTANKYDTLEAIEADIQLMVRNAITFNGAESLVATSAVKLGQKFSSNVARKRKELYSTKSSTPTPSASGGTSSGPPPAKKARIS
jgi:transcription initiation factor TFIID subunit 2